MKNKNIYKEIFELIDLSNAPRIYNSKTKQEELHPVSIQAEKELIGLGIYNDEGILITEDDLIINYYEDNWC